MEKKKIKFKYNIYNINILLYKYMNKKFINFNNKFYLQYHKIQNDYNHFINHGINEKKIKHGQKHGIILLIMELMKKKYLMKN